MPNAPAKCTVRPIVGLATWTFVMEIWMYAERISYFQNSKIEPDPNMLKSDMKSKLPRSVEWPAENYDHLHEQPTTWYAITLALALMNVQDSLTVGMAWTYVGLRVVHSLTQATGGPVMRRFGLFLLSSLMLLGMTVRTGMLLF